MSNIKGKQVPFRADIVGSFLRPEYLKKAREDYKNGIINEYNLIEIEDKAIVDLISKQKESGLSVITDGEFRRSWWHLDFMWGLNGVKKVEVEYGYRFNDETTRAESATLYGKITGENHPFVEHFKFIKSFEDETVIARQTIPAPAQFLAELQRADNLIETKKYYKDDEELISDIAVAYKTVILDLYNAGCRNVQLDDCTWGMFCDENYWRNRQGALDSREEIAKSYVRVNNLAIKDLPEDLIITTHVCRGNYHSTWASTGGYSSIAPILFGEENVSAYYLEFDDDRSGNFEPLKYVNGDKKVVLGLITSKRAELENKEIIISRIKEASKYIKLDNLFLSPQCGFASTEEGNTLTEEEQWDKIKLVIDIANEIWGN